VQLTLAYTAMRVPEEFTMEPCRVSVSVPLPMVTVAAVPPVKPTKATTALPAVMAAPNVTAMLVAPAVAESCAF
jgi:hypothetical protein